MKQFLEFLSINTDKSSKRLVGVIGAFCLFIAMFFFHTDTLYYCVTSTVLGSLGITAIDNFINKK
jgi:hypothetical protein